MLRAGFALACLLFPLPLSAQTLAGGIPDLCSSPTITSTQSGNWSSPSTWTPSRLPQNGDRVRVASNVTLDSFTASVACVGVTGTLSASRTVSSRLTAGTTLVYPQGWLDFGTTSSPIPAGVTAELVIADSPIDLSVDPEQYGTGLLVFGAYTSHGAVKTPWLPLSGELASGATGLSLGSSPVGWLAGDRLVIPDSRQIDTNYTPSFVTYGGGSTISAAPRWHLGARDLTGTLRFLPHVGNLSRNVIVRSANPSGVRGHVIVTDQALVDVRYTRFADLGRTVVERWLDSTTFDSFGNLQKIGTNQIGRYGFHLHRLKTKATLIGLAIERITKWGVAIHDSHGSVLSDSVIVDAGGASVMTEEGGESGNVIQRNLLILSKGTGSPDSASRGNTEFGYEGSCIWLAGPFNFVRDNVCANAWAIGYVVMPFAQKVSTPEGVKNTNAFPIQEFARNEAYASFYGMQLWDVGARSADYTWIVPGESLIKDFTGWHLAKRGVYHYPNNRVTYDGLVLINDPSRVWTNPVGLDWGDYSQRNVTVRNADIQAFRTCLTVPNKMGDPRDPYGNTATPMRIDDSTLDCQVGINAGTQWGVVGGGAYLAPRTTIVRNVTFPQLMPGSVYTLGFSTVSDGGILNSSGPRFNLIVKDQFYVESYNGNPGDDFQIYQDGQDPNRKILQSFGGHVGSPEAGLTNTQNLAKYGIAIAGGITPCQTTRFRIFGFTCGGGSSPPPLPTPTPTEEVCGDGIDNDGDGLIDEGCEVEPPPPPPNPEPVVIPPVTVGPLTLSVTPVLAGEAYTVTATVDINSNDVHVVKFDGQPWNKSWTSCGTGCLSFSRTYTYLGPATHTLTAKHAKGGDWPPAVLSVVVP